MLTSKELSEKLNKLGIKSDSEFYWVDRLLDRTEMNETAIVILHRDIITEYEPDGEIIAPAYDILNDLCVKYAREVFGDEVLICSKCGYKIIKKITAINICEVCGKGVCYTKNNGAIRCSRNILEMLQQNKPQKAIEDYIVANSILFK